MAHSEPSAPAATASKLERDPVESTELNADELTISRGLLRHGQRLVEIGERNPDKSWELADASDYLAGELEELGYGVERQGYDVDDVDLQNLSVTIPGIREAGRVLVVGAHYDSPASSPGAESALSTAALLEVARMMKGAHLTRTLKIAFFSLGESPHGDAEGRGARHFARKLSADATAGAPPGTPEPLRASYDSETMGFIHLGNFADFAPPQGTDSSEVFVHLAMTSGSNELVKTLEPALFGPPLRIRPEPWATAVGESDVLAFFEHGIPALSVFGAARPGAQDSLDSTRLDRAARVVHRLRAGIGEILGEKPQNDTMVTLP